MLFSITDMMALKMIVTITINSMKLRYTGVARLAKSRVKIFQFQEEKNKHINIICI